MRHVADSDIPKILKNGAFTDAVRNICITNTENRWSMHLLRKHHELKEQP